jgi:hypothetical protein
MPARRRVSGAAVRKCEFRYASDGLAVHHSPAAVEWLYHPVPQAKEHPSMKSSLWQAPFVASVIFLAANPADAQTLAGQAESCSTATLTGTYAYLLKGALYQATYGVFSPFADMGGLTADGKGNFTGSSSASVGGQILPRTITGTYSVNSNCTGQTTLTDNVVGTTHFNFTVLNNGQTITFIQADSGWVVFGEARPQQTSCSAGSINGLYGFSISGFFIDPNGNSDNYADSGQLSFNGAGALSISDTVSEGGQITSRSISGTYTLSPNCTGTAIFTDPKLGTFNMNIALSAGGQEIRFIDTDSGTIFSGTATALRDVGTSGTMAQVAAGGGWLTTFTLTNSGTSTANFELSFFDNNGNAVSLPLMFLDSGEITTSSALSQTLAAGATVVIVTNASSTAALVTGSAQLTSNGNVGGFAIFHYNPTAQEAVVPLETRNASGYILAFDNTNGLATGLALANVSSQAATVPVIVRDDVGTELGKATIQLAARGHTSFLLATEYGFSANRRGTIEFDTPANGQISALGLRAASTGSLTTIPVLAK